MRKRLNEPCAMLGTNCKAVLEATAKYYGIQRSDLFTVSNQPSIVRPRQVALYLLRHREGESFPQIGAFFGGMHHTTVMHSVNKITEMLKTEQSVRVAVTAIESMLVRRETEADRIRFAPQTSHVEVAHA